MADKYDVMKGLQCTNCGECPYQTANNCQAHVRKDALELIISQQAEIERLKEMQLVDNCSRCRFKDKCLTGRQLDR